MRPGNHITLEENIVAHSLTVYHSVAIISEMEKSIGRPGATRVDLALNLEYFENVKESS